MTDGTAAGRPARAFIHGGSPRNSLGALLGWAPAGLRALVDCNRHGNSVRDRAAGIVHVQQVGTCRRNVLQRDPDRAGFTRTKTGWAIIGLDEGQPQGKYHTHRHGRGSVIHEIRVPRPRAAGDTRDFAAEYKGGTQ